jgi:hypothetical protein
VVDVQQNSSEEGGSSAAREAAPGQMGALGPAHGHGEAVSKATHGGPQRQIGGGGVDKKQVEGFLL